MESDPESILEILFIFLLICVWTGLHGVCVQMHLIAQCLPLLLSVFIYLLMYSFIYFDIVSLTEPKAHD